MTYSDPRPGARRLVGLAVAFGLLLPLKAPAIELTPEVGLRYSSCDNIFTDYERRSRPSDQSPLGLYLYDRYGGEISDSYTALRYGLKARERTASSDLKLGAWGEQLKYAEYSELNASNKGYDASYSYRPSARLGLNLGGNWRDENQSERIEDAGLGLSRHRVGSLNASADYAISRRLAGRLSARSSSDDYSTDPQDNLDSDSLELGLRYGLSQRLNLLLQAQDRRYDFNDWYLSSSGSLRPNKFEEARSRNLSAGLSWALSPRLGLMAMLGGDRTVNRVNRPVYYLPDSRERGSIGQVGLNYAAPHLRLNFSAATSFGAQSSDQAASRRKSLSLDTGYTFNRELMMGLRFEAYEKDGQRRWQAIYGSYSEETTRRLSPWLSYKLTDELKLDLSYGFTRLRDHAVHNTKERRQADLKLSWLYPYKTGW